MLKKELVVINGSVVTSEKVLTKSSVFIRDGKIVRISKSKPKKGTEIIDAKGKFVCPGFIDVHFHGGGGHDFFDATPEAIEKILVAHLRHGTTTFLPTLLACSLERMYQFLDCVNNMLPRTMLLHKLTYKDLIPGIHLEGPYLNSQKKGAQLESVLRLPTIDEVRNLISYGKKIIKWITIAPELAGAKETINFLRKKRVKISAGHTVATYTETEQSIKYGVSHITHMFNAMRAFDHREPGIVGAALTKPELTVEVIADGIHIHPAVLKLVVQSKNIDDIILITDAIAGAGMPDGEYDLGGQTVIVKDNTARLKDGTLSGSVLTMDRAVGNIIKYTGVNVIDAIKMASTNPARLLGIDRHKGSIAVDKDADLVILNKNFQLETTIIKGQIVN